MQEKIDWYDNMYNFSNIRLKVNESFFIFLQYFIITILVIIILLFLLSPITNLYIANVFLIPLITITVIKYFRTQNLLFNSPIRVGISKKCVYLEYQIEYVFIPWYDVKKLIPLSIQQDWELHRKDGRIFKLNLTEKIIKEKMHQRYREFKADKRKKK